MWFKQVQLFQLAHPFPYKANALENKLAALRFKPCLPSLPQGQGWVAPLLQDDAPLIYAANGYFLFCLQIEEKILPATVIRQALSEKIKHIETEQQRKVRQREKNQLRDEITTTLLPRAFSKLSHIYAYIDTRNHWLVINSTAPKKVELFLAFFKRCLNCEFHPPTLKKLKPVMTRWLAQDSSPAALAIEKACVLQDPQQESRIVRCQQQNLFAQGVQAFIKEGCEVSQLALIWQDKINFTLTDEFKLRSIVYHDEVIETAKDNFTETAEQQFSTDFVIMTETLTQLLKSLLDIFAKQPKRFAENKETTIET